MWMWNLLEIKGIHGDAWHLVIHVGGKLKKACVTFAVAKLPIRRKHHGKQVV